jgi:type II secretory pathway component GspD/PulD (secretin)
VRRAAFIGLTVVVLAGCGGGGGQALTKEQYAAKADAICDKHNQETQALGNPTNLADLARVADKTLTILDKAISELEALKAPSSEKATADQWMEQVKNLRNDLKEIRDRAKDNDMQSVQGIAATAQEHNSKSNALATELGMSICNKD